MNVTWEGQEELFNIIQQSQLNPSQKKLWESVIAEGNEEDLSVILQSLQEEEELLELLTSSLEKKVNAHLSGNQEELDQILKEEEDLIESL